MTKDFLIIEFVQNGASFVLFLFNVKVSRLNVNGFISLQETIGKFHTRLVTRQNQ